MPVANAASSVNKEKHKMLNIMVRTRPKPVGDRPPNERRAVADQEQREEDAAVVADVRRGGGNSGAGQQFGQRRDQDKGVDERIHSVHAPAAPGGPEAANLVARELWFGVSRDRSLGGGHASPST